MNKEIKAVFIDWNGTLSISKFWGHLENPSHPKSHYFSAVETVLFTGELRQVLIPWMLGRITSEEVIQKLSTEINLPYEELLDEFIFSCKTMQLISPQVIDLVAQIRKQGIQVVIATDNMDSFDRWTEPALGLSQHFDAILNSFDLQAMKRDFDISGKNKFYSPYLEQIRIMPNQAVIIDDGDDKGLLSGMGFDYKRIEFGVGLVPVLQEIVER